MPATAAPQPGSEEPCLAPVVSLASRRGAKVTPGTETSTGDDAANADTELQERASQYWADVFAKSGIDLGSAETGAVVGLLTKELERLVGGMRVLREGGKGLPADPEAGMDYTSVVEMTGLLRDLQHAAETFRAKRG